MASPAPFHHAAHVPVELDVVEIVLGGLDLKGGLLVEIPKGADLFVSEEGVVVKVELRIQGQDLTPPHQDEGIDLGQRAIPGRIK